MCTHTQCMSHTQVHTHAHRPHMCMHAYGLTCLCQVPPPQPTPGAHPWGCYPGPPRPQLLRFVSPRSHCASYETKHNPWFVDASAVLKWKGPQQPGLWGVPVSCLARVLLNAQTGAVCPRSSQKPGWWASRRWWERLWQECALYLWPRGGSRAELHALGLDPLGPYQNWNTSLASSKQTAGIPYYFQVHLKRRALTSGLDPAVTPTHFLEVLLGSRTGTQCPAPETTGHASAHAQTVLSQAAPGCCLLLPSLGGAHCHLPPATLLWPEAAHGLTC